MTFMNNKKTFLAKVDQSKKGSIDARVTPLLDTINKKADYYTTSSCSGRVYLWKGTEKKSEMEWLRVSHDLIDEDFVKIGLGGPSVNRPMACSLSLTAQPNFEHASIPKIISVLLANHHSLEWWNTPRFNIEKSGVVWLRLEPFILHVACKDLECASAFLEKARRVYKKSSLLSTGSKIMVEVRGSEFIEMPLYKDGKLLFCGDKEWLRKMINTKLQKIWAGTATFAKNI